MSLSQYRVVYVFVTGCYETVISYIPFEENNRNIDATGYRILVVGYSINKIV